MRPDRDDDRELTVRYDPNQVGGWDYRSRRRAERDEAIQRGWHELEPSRMNEDPNSPDACPDCGYTGWKGRRCYGRAARTAGS
jgi:hypothetical protein